MKNLFRSLRYDWPLHFTLLLLNWLPDNVKILKLRGYLCRPFLGKCGTNLRLGRNIVFYNPSNISIGNNVYIAFNNWISAGAPIFIGDNIDIAPGCVIVSGSHSYKGGNFNHVDNSEKYKIEIESGSWIAANVNIVGGTHIGKSCVIAAGCSVKGIIPDKSLVAGSLAIVKKKFT